MFEYNLHNMTIWMTKSIVSHMKIVYRTHIIYTRLMSKTLGRWRQLRWLQLRMKLEII